MRPPMRPCTVLLFSLLTACAPALAEAPSWAEALEAILPATEQVRAQLEQQPAVRAASAGQAAAAARRDRLEAGPNEWSLRTGVQQRQEQPGPRYLETEVALEHGLRSQDKRQTDQALGRTETDIARLNLEDGWHECARDLLKIWFNALREQQAAHTLEQQGELARQQRQVAQRRLQAGEAARLELLQAEAELARLQAAVQQAQGRARLSRQELRRRYPGLQPAADRLADPTLTLPEPPTTGISASQWVDRLLDDNHELELAEAQARLASLQARRTGLDKQGDPVFGLHASRERGGQEQVLGVYVTLPLGGAGRRADEQGALALADVAEQKAALVRQRVSSEAWQIALQAEEAPAAWRSLESARQGLEQAASLASRAYTLGELPLGEALQARRLALEARLAADAARVDALESEARLLLDSHLIWLPPTHTEP